MPAPCVSAWTLILILTLCLQWGKLRDYQLESLNWMIYSWSEDRNIVLADEVGICSPGILVF